MQERVERRQKQQGRRVELERPSREAWLCPQCHRPSRDARHVCQYCLTPEPSYYQAVTSLDKASDTETKEVTRVTPSTSADKGVQLITIDTTQRVYRIYTEPIRPAVEGPRHNNSKRQQEAHVDAAEHVSAEEDTSSSERDSDSDAKGVADAAAVPIADQEEEAPSNEIPVRTMTLDQVVSATRLYNDKSNESASSWTAGQRKAAPYTHFLALTIGQLPEAQASAHRLLDALRAFAGGRDAHRGRLVPQLVQNPARLHITLLLLTLENDEAVQLAKALLHDQFLPAWQRVKAAATEEGKDKALANESNSSETGAAASRAQLPLSPVVSLGGLHVMPQGNRDRPDVRHARVVYMGLRDASSQHFVRTLQDTLHSAFAELITDFAEAARSKRTPHMTMMNEKWRHAEDEAATTSASAQGPQTFDASVLLSRFAATAYIGAGASGREPLTLRSVDLCRRGAHDPVTQGYIVEDSVRL